MPPHPMSKFEFFNYLSFGQNVAFLAFNCHFDALIAKNDHDFFYHPKCKKIGSQGKEYALTLKRASPHQILPMNQLFMSFISFLIKPLKNGLKHEKILFFSKLNKI